MLLNLKKYFQLVKFSHTIFAMPFAIIGFLMGIKVHSNSFSWLLLLAVILCMVFARNAAMSFNRYIDHHFDKLNPRTKDREIPRGIISPSQALLFSIINAIFFISCSFFINWLCFLLSPIALLIIYLYSYTKRFTAWCHFILGLGLALAPIGAYLAVTANFAWQPILLSFAVILWVSGFDIIYALQDISFDKKIGLKSIPSKFGVQKSLFVSLLLHISVILILTYIALNFAWGIYFKIGVAIFCFLLIYQHFVVKPNNLSQINQAFFTTNGLASLLLGCLTLIDVIF